MARQAGEAARVAGNSPSHYFDLVKKFNPLGKVDRKLSGLEWSEKCSVVKNKEIDMLFKLRQTFSKKKKKKEKVLPNIKHGCM